MCKRCTLASGVVMYFFSLRLFSGLFGIVNIYFILLRDGKQTLTFTIWLEYGWTQTHKHRNTHTETRNNEITLWKLHDSPNWSDSFVFISIHGHSVTMFGNEANKVGELKYNVPLLKLKICDACACAFVLALFVRCELCVRCVCVFVCYAACVVPWFMVHIKYFWTFYTVGRCVFSILCLPPLFLPISHWQC